MMFELGVAGDKKRSVLLTTAAASWPVMTFCAVYTQVRTQLCLERAGLAE